MDVLLTLHIAAGGVSLVAGAIALFSRKGFRAHRALGAVFCVAMLCMSAAGVVIAVVRNQPDNVVVGALTFYLVATGWLTVIRRADEMGFLEGIALIGAWTIVATASTYGLQAAQSDTRLRGGVSAESFYGMAAIAASFAFFDMKAMARGGVSGARRLSRHLWRLGFALFIATLSLFVGQQQVFPEPMRESRVLAGPVLLVAATVLFWLVKIRFRLRPERPLVAKRQAALLGSIMFSVLPLLPLIALPSLLPVLARGADWRTAETEEEVIAVTRNQDGSVRETTIWIAVLDGDAFVRTSGTPWGRNLDRHPDIVLRIAGEDHPVRAERILDATLIDRVQVSFREKYGPADGAARFVRFVMGGSRIYRARAR